MTARPVRPGGRAVSSHLSRACATRGGAMTATAAGLAMAATAGSTSAGLMTATTSDRTAAMIATTTASASATTAFSATVSLGDRDVQRLVVQQNERRCGQCHASHERKGDLTIGT